ncbi:MAG: thiosulfate oxidation carrier protein SoxY [Paracoccaceae bacterium]|jgi:sulfur-oxidizing protein SoxY|nr:thiosulfate oxidation carrier protein SoxY [Paracoccaceae bacterium]MDG1372773.1 thiosulfate oxidation carrier protein SoxY [Paracoccaceae bacterium]MDG1971748.1 thiosulfate oxidation carrier protein SoxY [Paracoccaceae bacterium]
MNLTRRDALWLTAGAAITASLPLPALAATPEDIDADIAAFTGGADVKEGGVEITAPEIAENGNTVPVEVSAPGATSILLLAAGNPNPGVATFNFGPLSAASEAKTRIRLAGTQDLIAVAKMADGSFAMSKRSVKVTIGGCGG